LHTVTASDALAHEKDVGYRPPAGGLMQEGLQLLAHRVLIELDDVGFRYDAVLLEEDVLGFLRVRAVGFREDDHYNKLADVLRKEVCGTNWGSSSESRSSPSRLHGLQVFHAPSSLLDRVAYRPVEQRLEPFRRPS
jgi:hypothetical protein